MNPSPGRVRVLLLFGGRSAEHDVSRVTAVAVAKALDPARYEVLPVAITTDGRWLLAEQARRMIEEGPKALPAALPVAGEPVSDLGDLVARGEQGEVEVRSPLDADVVLPLLHGPYGEDGTVQGLLELAGLPYVGSGVVGSAVGMDKVMMKRAFQACGLPIARYASFRDGHDRMAFAAQVEAELGYPCFVKPVNLGSSVGVSKAKDRSSFDAALDLALRFDEWALVEEAVGGREIEVAILGDDPPQASLPGEIVPGDEFYSYADKYEQEDAQLLAPAPLSPEQTNEVRQLALRAFEACRCEAMARVDFFLEENRDGEGRGFLVNEVNTIPGFVGGVSMYPRLWEVSGISYPKLLDQLIELAFARHERRAKRAGRQRDE
ncbi:MAG TPA: D-alanine--D-alanine ligase family protein [Acidimicrobiia bacterium]|jgi:D-alanine--D-alanine ligase|nr:D-alanine--D-alanine ligase family protein [Acidimicrobiia bacterium]